MVLIENLLPIFAKIEWNDWYTWAGRASVNCSYEIHNHVFEIGLISELLHLNYFSFSLTGYFEGSCSVISKEGSFYWSCLNFDWDCWSKKKVREVHCNGERSRLSTSVSHACSEFANWCFNQEFFVVDFHSIMI
jgi:hypothetical protein